MDNRVVVGLIVFALLVVIGLALWAYQKRQKRRTDRLRERFGPEYEHVMQERGNQRRAEADLEARTQRVEALQIRELDPSERTRFADAWSSVQERFVDDPKEAVGQADRLVGEAMRARGYPVGEFEQRAADISVHHPRVVDTYRAAHDIALRAECGEASTEDLRHAMLSYRALFEDLLNGRRSGQMEPRHERAA